MLIYAIERIYDFLFFLFFFVNAHYIGVDFWFIFLQGNDEILIDF
jgi:hypothetical protein